MSASSPRNLPSAAVQRAVSLRILAESDLITSERKGRTLLYRADISHPLVREAKVFSNHLRVNAIHGRPQRIRYSRNPFRECATGEDTEESDIDLFIETSNKPGLQKIIAGYEESISRKISPIILSAEEGGQPGPVTGRCTNGFVQVRLLQVNHYETQV